MPESRVRSVLQSIFRVRLHNSSSSSNNSDVTNGNSSGNNDNDASGNNLLALEHTNELLMQQEQDDPHSYSEVMSSILMEVLTLMSAGKFPPGVKKKEHATTKAARLRYLADCYRRTEETFGKKYAEVGNPLIEDSHMK